ncbi:MAG: L,D-transpeptidase [Sphingobacteriia bacterium]|nr:L,D-transpeptidase [Sphingobacteriia bacterium]
MKKILLFSICATVIFLCTSFKRPVANPDDYYIVIIKHNYEMKLYDANNNWLITYPVVFGSKDMGDKMYQGDRRTPEGTFHIVAKKDHHRWNKFLALDYPNEESYQKFNERKAQGLIPQNAQIGGDIGIHGTWPHEEFAVDQYQNWTLGCVSTKNEYITEMYNALPVGTKVIIKY